MKKLSKDMQLIVEEANSFFKFSLNSDRSHRRAIHSLVTNILLKSNVYRGFRYLNEDEVPPGNSWGITFDDVNHDHIYPDDSRISFNY